MLRLLLRLGARVFAMGYEGLRPLLAALIAHVDSDRLREGSHHVCHDLAQSVEGQRLQPLLDALNAAEPELTVPGQAYAVWKNLESIGAK